MLSFITHVPKVSFAHGDVPLDIKSALISPIFKGGDRSLPKSYRPVALTSHLSKVFERVIRVQIMDYLESRGLLDGSQHGSRGGRSTLSQLLIQQEKLLSLLEDGDNVDLVYLDFSKAFDKVDLGLLLLKVKALGINGALGRWLARFILGRRQAVKVGSRTSKWSSVISGVPQGSVLGPLLFLIFIGDLGIGLDDNEDAFILKYVDDMKAMRRITDEEDVETFQNALNTLYNWQEANNMEYNGSKFQLLRFGRIDILKDSTLLFTSDVQDIIEPVHVVKDLGVLMDDQASFKAHRAEVVKKTKMKASWVLRTFRSRDQDLMKALWRSLVQPIQDYCGQLWSPSNISGEIHEQEAPLKSYTRRIRGLRDVSYWSRLKTLNMLSTQRCQERYKILYIFKMLQELVPNNGVRLREESVSLIMYKIKKIQQN